MPKNMTLKPLTNSIPRNLCNRTNIEPQFLTIHPKTQRKQISARNIPMDEQFLMQRRQNHLNTCFNRRKNRLVQITKENKYIYRRINAQKSFYTSRQLNKSIDSNCSSRKSLSRQSSSNNSRILLPKPISSGSSILRNKLVNNQKKASSIMKFESYNVNNVERSHIDNIADIFKSNKEKQAHRKTNSSVKTYYTKPSFSRFQPHATETLLPSINGDGMLHRIAQQMYNHTDKRIRKRKAYL